MLQMTESTLVASRGEGAWVFRDLLNFWRMKMVVGSNSYYTHNYSIKNNTGDFVLSTMYL